MMKVLTAALAVLTLACGEGSLPEDVNEPLVEAGGPTEEVAESAAALEPLHIHGRIGCHASEENYCAQFGRRVGLEGKCHWYKNNYVKNVACVR